MSAQKSTVHRLFTGIDSEMELLLALGKHVTTELDLGVLLQLVADTAREVIDARTLVVPLIDFETGEYRYRSAAGENAELIVGQSFPLSVGMCGWVLSNQRPLLFGRGNALPMGNKTRWEEGMESALLVPLISRGRIIGGLSGLGKQGNGSFVQRDLELLTVFANQASVAVENAQILEQLNRQQGELEALLETTRFEKQLAEVTLEAIADGVAVTDVGGRIVSINKAAQRLIGLEQCRVVGKQVEQVVPISGWYGEHADYPVYEALAHDRIVPIASGVLSTADANELLVEGSVSILRGGDHRPIGAVMLFRDVTDQRRMVEEIHRHATYDPLTGLVNRREFEHRLQHALDRALREDSRHALCFVDLDRFKVVNDSCGHAAGDELLRLLGTLLSRRVRERDTLARIGGDEFALLLENCPLENAMRIAESLRQDVEDLRFAWDQRVFRVGASIGLVMISPQSGELNGVLGLADQACYVAKEQGGNRVRVFTESDEQLAQRSSEMQWVSRLNVALETDRFELYGQPIVATEDPGVLDNACRYEILIRLRESEGAVLPPGVFLRAGERYGLMEPIDRWVIDRYLAWLSRHPGHLQRLQRCSINLSAQSIADEQLCEFVRAKIDQYQVPAEKLCFEITETAAIANLAGALGLITEMRLLGVTFALDDFGTGLSSFGYLKELPVDSIKIDGSLIKNVLADELDATLVQTIVQIGNAMGVATIAEYVESAEIFERVRGLGVDFAQGYGISKPVPLDYLLGSHESAAQLSSNR